MTPEQRLKDLDNRMMPYGSARFIYVNAVRDDRKFRICLMKIAKDHYAATTSPGLRQKSLVLRAYGKRPSEAFQKVTRQIDWNLREMTAAELLAKITPGNSLYFDRKRSAAAILKDSWTASLSLRLTIFTLGFAITRNIHTSKLNHYTRYTYVLDRCYTTC